MTTDSTLLDNVQFEKERDIAKFNGLPRIVQLRQLFEVLVCFGLISWSSARVPAILQVAGRCFVEVSTFLFNHHVVFLIGNVIIVSLFVICRKGDGFDLSTSDYDDIDDDCVKHGSTVAVHQREASPPPPAAVTESIEAAEVRSGGGDEEKQIVVRTEFDEMAIAIEEATRQIRRFQRTQSEKLKREIAVRPRPDQLRRSETDIYRRTAESGDQVGTGEIETLSSEDFRLTIEAFIEKHWNRKKGKSN